MREFGMHWGEAITAAIPRENGEMGGRGGLSVEGKGVKQRRTSLLRKG